SAMRRRAGRRRRQKSRTFTRETICNSWPRFLRASNKLEINIPSPDMWPSPPGRVSRYHARGTLNAIRILSPFVTTPSLISRPQPLTELPLTGRALRPSGLIQTSHPFLHRRDCAKMDSAPDSPADAEVDLPSCPKA